MLGFMYTDNITVKPFASINDYGDKTYSADIVIKGSLQGKTSNRIDGNGNIVVTDLLIFSNIALNQADIIVHNGRERDIVSIDCVRNHLTGGISHYEYRL